GVLVVELARRARVRSLRRDQRALAPELAGAAARRGMRFRVVRVVRVRGRRETAGDHDDDDTDDDARAVLAPRRDETVATTARVRVGRIGGGLTAHRDRQSVVARPTRTYACGSSSLERPSCVRYKSV